MQGSVMSEPDYKRPFDQEDFRGYIKWTQKFTQQYAGDHLYHACHEEELRQILDEGELGLRSQWSMQLPNHGLWHAPGVLAVEAHRP